MKRLMPALLTAAALGFASCNAAERPADAPAGPRTPRTPPAASPTPAARPGMGNPDAVRPTSPTPGPGPTDEPGLIRPSLFPQPRPSNPYVQLVAERTARPAPGPMIPSNAQFTLLCRSFTGPNHVAQASAVKGALLQSTNLPGWYLVHQPERSELYYGYYAAVEDPNNPAETRRAQADRQAVQAMDDGAGGKPFGKAVFVPLDTPDPSAPQQWNLVNARGAYTLEIASYTGAGRKEAAVESVKQARETGVDAYYYHGDAVSSVCIGTFPASAVQGAVNGGDTGPVAYGRRNMPGANDAASMDPDTALVVSSTPLPDNFRDAKDADGRPVKVVQPHITYSAALLALKRQYPQHFINGDAEGVKQTDPNTRREVLVPKESMVVRIPEGQASLLAGGAGGATAQPGNQPAARAAISTPRDAPNLLDPNARSHQGGRLRSIRD